MRARLVTGFMAAALALAGCGGSDEPEKKDNAFEPLVTTPKKVEDRTDAAADQYRDSMNQRLEQDEGGSREEPAGD